MFVHIMSLHLSNHCQSMYLVDSGGKKGCPGEQYFPFGLLLNRSIESKMDFNSAGDPAKLNFADEGRT